MTRRLTLRAILALLTVIALISLRPAAAQNAASPLNQLSMHSQQGDYVGAGKDYLFNAEGMREAVKGFDIKRALDVLQEAGALPGTAGERSKAQRIDGRLMRLYPIQADKLGADHVA